MSDATSTLAPMLPPAARQDMALAPQVHTGDEVLHAHPGECVLETLERHGHQIEFQCRSGYCGACRTRLLAGRVHYPRVPLAFISPDECLPCCCEAVGVVKLDIVDRPTDQKKNS